jgi:hypothetical protein
MYATQVLRFATSKQSLSLGIGGVYNIKTGVASIKINGCATRGHRQAKSAAE